MKSSEDSPRQERLRERTTTSFALQPSLRDSLRRDSAVHTDFFRCLFSQAPSIRRLTGLIYASICTGAYLSLPLQDRPETWFTAKQVSLYRDRKCSRNREMDFPDKAPPE